MLLLESAVFVLEGGDGVRVVRVLLVAGGKDVADLLVDPAQSSLSHSPLLLLLGRQQLLSAHFNIKL